MKLRTFFGIALCFVALQGCKMDLAPLPADSVSQYVIKLNLHNFTTRIEELNGVVKLKAAAEETKQPYVDGIYYFVYDADGKLLKTQYSGSFIRLPGPNGTWGENPDFGIFSDTLAEGTYRLAFAATHDLIGEVDGNYNYNSSEIRGELGEPLAHIPDIFYRELMLEVSEDTFIDTLTLERMVGSIDVRLTDETFPDNYHRITWNYTTYDVFPFSENNQWASGRKREFNVHFADFLHNHEDRWQKEKSFESFVIPDRKTGKLTSAMRITALDKAGEVIAYKVIDGIEVEKNKRVILSGKLFSGGDPLQGFVVRTDSAYSDTEIIEF